MERNYDLTFKVMDFPGLYGNWNDVVTWKKHLFIFRVSEIGSRSAFAMPNPLLLEDTHDFEEKVYAYVNDILKRRNV